MTIMIIGCLNSAFANDNSTSIDSITTDNPCSDSVDSVSVDTHTSDNDNTDSIANQDVKKSSTTTCDSAIKSVDTSKSGTSKTNSITTDSISTNSDDTNSISTNSRSDAKNLKQDGDSSTTTEDVNTFSGLENAVENAKTSNSTNYVINLETNNYTVTSELKWSDIEGDVVELTINGHDSILDGNGLYRFLHVNSNTTVVLNDMTIANMSANIGGALYNSGNVTLNNVNFTDNHCTITSTYGGGAIYNTGVMEMTGCVFTNNTSDSNGGAIYNTVLALEKDGRIMIENCSFIENTAKANGGVIYNYINSMEDNNESIRINNSVFKHNSAQESSAIYNYYGKEFIITNSSFINHTGSILIHYYVPESGRTSTEEILEHNMTLVNVTIESNNVDTLIKNEGYMILDNVTISDNDVTDVIESIYLKMEDSKVHSNSAEKLVTSDLYLEVTRCEFTENNITNIAINNTEATVIIDGSIFQANKLGDYLIYDADGNTSLYNNSFISNECSYLFKSTNEVFNSVVDNIYTSNNIKGTSLHVTYNNTYNYNENVTITGLVSTEKIYNTTINSGVVSLVLDGKTIATSNITNGEYYFNLPIDETGTFTLTIAYDGNNDFEDMDEIITITILTPELDLEIVCSNDIYSYEDIIEYTITVTNNKEANAESVVVKNTIPERMKIIDVSDQSYDLTTNTWTIDKLDSYESKTLVIRTLIEDTQDIRIFASVYDPTTKEEKTDSITIKYIQPTLDVDIKIDDSYILGSNLDSQITVNNTGLSNANNMTIEVTLSDGSEVFSNITSSLGDITAGSCELFNSSSRITRYGNITLTVTVSDLLNNTISKNYTFTVLEPNVVIDELTAHRGDVINITARFENVVSDFTGKIVFKMNYVTLYDYEVVIEDDTITLLNYKIKDDMVNSQQVLEIKYDEKAFNNVLVGNSMLTLIQYDVTSSVTGYIKNNYINLEATILDEYGNPVSNGKVIFKINGITLKGSDGKNLYVDVVDGKAVLSDYLYSQDLFKDVYNITVVYSGNSKYSSTRSDSLVNATTDKQNVDIQIQNSTYNKKEDYEITINLTSSVTGDFINGGNLVVKINGKTMSPKISVTNTTIVYTYTSESPVNMVHNITICYSGSHRYEETKVTFDFDVNNLKTLDSMMDYTSNHNVTSIKTPC